MSAKGEAFAAARRVVREAWAGLEAQLAELDEALAGETKSSAGDKYETGRERLAQERARLSGQLHVASARLTALEVAERAPANGRVGVGSYVEVEGFGPVLIAVGLGRVTVPGLGKPVAVVSLESPIGKALFGRGVKDCITVNARTYVVTDVR